MIFLQGMPIYEFACETCAERFEEHKRITDRSAPPCPRCGKETRRLISATSFALKGTGWYATDYRKPGASSSAEK
jgi:putative FmdB family regulatory protein